MDVGIDCAEDDAAARVEQFVGVKLVPPGLPADQHCCQEAQMKTRLPLHVHGAWPDHNPVREKIEGCCSNSGEQQKADQPFLEVCQERQREDVEPQVLAEERVGLAEGDGLAKQEVVLPVGRAPEGGDQGQNASHAADGATQVAPERLRKAEQHEGVHRAPVAGRLVPSGQVCVGEEHEEEDRAEQPADPCLSQQDRRENGLVADLAKPEPVHVEREGIAEREEQGQQEEKKDEQSCGAHWERTPAGTPARRASSGMVVVISYSLSRIRWSRSLILEVAFASISGSSGRDCWLRRNSRLSFSSWAF